MYRNVYIGVPKDRCRQADFDSALPMAFQSAPMSLTITYLSACLFCRKDKGHGFNLTEFPTGILKSDDFGQHHFSV